VFVGCAYYEIFSTYRSEQKYQSATRTVTFLLDTDIQCKIYSKCDILWILKK